MNNIYIRKILVIFVNFNVKHTENNGKIKYLVYFYTNIKTINSFLIFNIFLYEILKKSCKTIKIKYLNHPSNLLTNFKHHFIINYYYIIIL